MSRARDVVEVIARELADRAEDISVTERDGQETTHVELSTAGRDRRVVVDFVDDR